jgi:hypothetical protein
MVRPTLGKIVRVPMHSQQHFHGSVQACRCLHLPLTNLERSTSKMVRFGTVFLPLHRLQVPAVPLLGFGIYNCTFRSQGNIIHRRRQTGVDRGKSACWISSSYVFLYSYLQVVDSFAVCDDIFNFFGHFQLHLDLDCALQAVY